MEFGSLDDALRGDLADENPFPFGFYGCKGEHKEKISRLFRKRNLPLESPWFSSFWP